MKIYCFLSLRIYFLFLNLWKNIWNIDDTLFILFFFWKTSHLGAVFFLLPISPIHFNFQTSHLRYVHFFNNKKNVKRHIFLVRNKNLKFEATIFSETVTTIQSHIISMYKRFHSFYNQTEDHEILFRKWDPICSKFDIPCVNKIFIV